MLSRASRLTGHGIVICRANADESRRDRWKAPGSEVSTFLFEENEKNNKKEKSLPYAFNQHHPASRARAHGTHTYTYVLRTILTRETLYTRKIIHTEQKKKRNTIILYSRSAFCLQFHFNLLFVNLPSTLRKALHTCAQKRYKKEKKERRHHFC